MALTDNECKKAQPKDKQYRLSDLNGLSLIVTPKGNKYWNVRITVHGQYLLPLGVTIKDKPFKSERRYCLSLG